MKRAQIMKRSKKSASFAMKLCLEEAIETAKNYARTHIYIKDLYSSRKQLGIEWICHLNLVIENKDGDADQSATVLYMAESHEADYCKIAENFHFDGVHVLATDKLIKEQEHLEPDIKLHHSAHNMVEDPVVLPQSKEPQNPALRDEIKPYNHSK